MWLQLDCGASPRKLLDTVDFPRVHVFPIRPATYHFPPLRMFRAALSTRMVVNRPGQHAKAAVDWSTHRDPGVWPKGVRALGQTMAAAPPAASLLPRA
jgi:hypothetical protein